jgi:hypothetical protein
MNEQWMDFIHDDVGDDANNNVDDDVKHDVGNDVGHILGMSFVIISMTLKLKEKMNCPPILDPALMNHNSSLDIEFEKNINKKVCGVIDFFSAFLTKYDERKTGNMLSLMLDSRIKSLKLIYSFINCEQGVAIIEKYHKRSLFLIF